MTINSKEHAKVVSEVQDMVNSVSKKYMINRNTCVQYLNKVNITFATV